MNTLEVLSEVSSLDSIPHPAGHPPGHPTDGKTQPELDKIALGFQGLKLTPENSTSTLSYTDSMTTSANPSIRPSIHDILDIICSENSSLSILAQLSQLNKDFYETVIPHLYRSIPLTPFILPLLIRGIDSRKTSCSDCNPCSTEGCQEDGQTATQASKDRMDRCFAHVRELRIGNELPGKDLTKFLEDANNGTITSCSCSPPTTVTDTSSTYFPNAVRIIIGGGFLESILSASESHRNGHRRPLPSNGHCPNELHPFVAFIQNLAKAHTVVFPGGSMRSRRIESGSKNNTELLKYRQEAGFFTLAIIAKLGVDQVIYHGIRKEILPHSPGRHVVIHFMPIASVKTLNNETSRHLMLLYRLSRIYFTVRTRIPFAPSTYRIIGAGFLGHSIPDEQEIEIQNVLQDMLARQNQFGEVIPQGVLDNIEWFTVEQAIKMGLDRGCGCYEEQRIQLASGKGRKREERKRVLKKKVTSRDCSARLKADGVIVV